MIELDVLSATDVAADDDAQAAAGQAPTWRSRESRDGAAPTAEFQAPVTAADAGTSRRSFMKVMGASVALAGLSGCRRPVETILPYARKPEDVVPGIPDYFATAMPLGGVGFPLLVQSHEGRPTKVEGNPEHPMSQGASGAFAQASVLQLYDPDRSRFVWTKGAAAPARADWGAFVAEANRLRGAAPRVAVLAAPTSSPTAKALRDRFLAAYPGARWITVGPHLDDAQALGIQDAIGQPARPLHRLADADVVVSFDADFLGEENPNSVFDNRQYAASRRVDERGSMSRLYVVESTMTITGGMADHRKAAKAGAIPFVAAAVAERLGLDTGADGLLVDDEALAPFLDAIAEDVRGAGGRAAFLAGPTQPREVHALVAALNGRFGGDVVEYLTTGDDPARPVADDLVALVADMAAGNVDLLLALGTNPVYTLPAELNFAEAMARVPTTIHHGLYRDETGQLATWHLPATHYLESWGDVRAYDGTVSIVQPLIAPLYDPAHSELEVLNALTTGRNNAGYDLLRLVARGYLGGDFETAWRVALHDGFVAGTGYAPVGAAAAATPDLSGLPVPAADALELVTRLSPTLYDGAFSNVSWMQELPHPVTKVTWDPVALVSPATAIALGVEDAERFVPGEDDQFEGTTVEDGKNLASVVRFTTPGGTLVDLPVWVQPGHPDGSVTAFLGYGRALATDRPVEDLGVIGKVNRWLRPGKHDTNVYRMGPLSDLVGAELENGPVSARVEGVRSLAGPVVPAVAPLAVADDYLLASTQDHGQMEGRAIVRMASLDEYRSDPAFAKIADHYVEDTPWENFEPLWGDQNAASEDPRIGDWIYSENQWGMTIDLNACTGCNACVVACQSENNVPVVGKDQVAIGREMHWLRMDRYYVGADEADPGMVQMPMMCVHCENAPCEQVCPVNATAHSPDGLNEMTYNRCIGTRYCANNCPYKVRRYNFYNWTKELPVEVQMQSNPYVTVRYRGVMEKCTFCVQRIRQRQQVAHIEDAPIPDGELVTACQQACPADAIVFGDLKDRTSAVARAKESPRNYALLAELAVKPRLTYLARLRNPSPALAAFDTRFDALDAHGAAGAHTEAEA